MSAQISEICKILRFPKIQYRSKFQFCFKFLENSISENGDGLNIQINFELS